MGGSRNGLSRERDRRSVADGPHIELVVVVARERVTRLTSGQNEPAFLEVRQIDHHPQRRYGQGDVGVGAGGIWSALADGVGVAAPGDRTQVVDAIHGLSRSEGVAQYQRSERSPRSAIGLLCLEAAPGSIHR